MNKDRSKIKSWFIDIVLLVLVLISFLGYSGYLLYKDYSPNKDTLEENKKITQVEIIKHDESSKEFDEIIKKLEEKRNKPKQLEIEKLAQIEAEKEKIKRTNQKPQKKEQKMVRYEDWIDEPSEALPIEELELEKIQGPEQDER